MKSTSKPTGILKATPNCFIVQEISKNGIVPLHNTTRVNGKHDMPVTYFHLVKRGITTRDALMEVAAQLKTSIDRISYYGMKDRHAHTAQCIGVEGDFLPCFTHSDIQLVQQGTGQYRLRRGGNEGNRFHLLVLSSAQRLNKDMLTAVPNFFGKQRFGTPRGHEIGQLLLEGKFEEAADLLAGEGLGNRVETLRVKTGSLKGALLHQELHFEIGLRVLQWQSHLWNLLLREQGDKVPDLIPMWDPDNTHIYEHLWNPAHLDRNTLAFLHRFKRRTRVHPRNITLERKLLGWEIKFDLPSGSYATVVLSQVFDLQEEHIN